MTYEQLLTLDAIVQHGSFKAAADFLHKSQPALSASIKKLEEEFQFKIFNREEYRPKLTAEGKIFYEKSRIALTHMKSLELFGEELGLGTEAEIRVGIDGLSPLDLILGNLKTFFKDYPSTNLTLLMENISGTLNKLKNGEIDFGFTPLIEDYEGIEAIKVCQIKMIPVCTPTFFSLIKNDMDILKNLPQTVVTDSGPKNDLNFGVLKGARKWIVSDVASKKSIIENGLGWGRLPDFLIQKELDQKKLVPIRLPEVEGRAVKIYMVRNKCQAMGPISKKLWEKYKNLLHLKKRSIS